MAAMTPVEPLFLQLHVFTGCRDVASIAEAVGAAGLQAVVYDNVNDPMGFGIMFACRNPDEIVDRVGPLLRSPEFASLRRLPEFTMLGRTYLIGYERDPEEVLLHRPLSRLLSPLLRWAVWYPLRRSGSFERLASEDQRNAMKEHGAVGASFGRNGAAHDVRLSCHGLDASDNDFVIGILGPELVPLSSLVEAMRKTVQTSMYLEKLGPFFVGRVRWQATA